MVVALGFDIGGANTKAALITLKNGKLQSEKLAAEYFPVWRESHNLPKVLLRLKEKLCAIELDCLGITLTAELSDAYQTKREGVTHILSCVKQAFPDVPTYVLTSDSKLQSIQASINEPLSVAAANWAATGWLVAQHIRDAVVVDVGSTSTSIIPIREGKVAALGKTDLDKLVYGELVYTGSLRTNVAAITPTIPTRRGVAGVSSELFALSGDVHLILKNISEKQYTSETADGRGKTVPEVLARLARVVCADIEMLSKQEIVDMAKYVYQKQILQVMEGLSKVYSHVKSEGSQKTPVVVTGLGKDFLARKAAEQINVDAVIDLGTLLQTEAVFATPAFGVALMAARDVEGGTIN